MSMRGRQQASDSNAHASKRAARLTRNRELARAARRGRNFGLDARRLTRNRLIWTLVLALPVLLLASGFIRFVSMPLTQAWALSAYSKGDYHQVPERLWLVDHANYFESYLPHLTRGTALLQDGKSAEAEQELQTSLELWSKASDLNQPAHAECKIRNNLSIAMAMEAQKIDEAAERADALYAAEEVLAPCLNGGSSSDSNEDQSSTGKTGEQIEKQRKEADQEAGNEERESPGRGGPNEENDPQKNDPQGDKEGGQSPTADPEEQKKQEQLEEQNKGSENGNSGDGDDEGENEDDSKVTKPW